MGRSKKRAAKLGNTNAKKKKPDENDSAADANSSAAGVAASHSRARCNRLHFAVHLHPRLHRARCLVRDHCSTRASRCRTIADRAHVAARVPAVQMVLPHVPMPLVPAHALQRHKQRPPG